VSRKAHKTKKDGSQAPISPTKLRMAYPEITPFKMWWYPRHNIKGYGNEMIPLRQKKKKSGNHLLNHRLKLSCHRLSHIPIR